jgi:GT2 family glycosyltransferase
VKKVFVVILNYKGHDDTKELLNSLKNLKKEDFELNVVVVDNCPEDRINLVESRFVDLNLRLIYNGKNLGFSGGNNVGMEFALSKGADYIVILNNDTIVDSSFISELVKVAEQDKSAGIVVPKIYFAKGYEFHKRYKENELGRVIWYAGGEIDWNNVIGHHRGVDEVDNGQYDETVETQIASGCCFLIKTDVVRKIGMYDDKFFLYYEDADLSIRVKKSGYKLVYAPKSIIWHKNAQSTGGSGSSIQDYFITRNRLLFGLKYAPFRAKLALARESLRLMTRGRPWQKSGAADFYLFRFGKGRVDL